LSKIPESNGTTNERIALGEKDSIRADFAVAARVAAVTLHPGGERELSSDGEVVVTPLERATTREPDRPANPAQRARSVQRV